MHSSIDRFFRHACVNGRAGATNLVLWDSTAKPQHTLNFSKLIIHIHTVHTKKRTGARSIIFDLKLNGMWETSSSEAIPQFCKRFSHCFSYVVKGREELEVSWPHPSLCGFSKNVWGEVWLLSRIDTNYSDGKYQEPKSYTITAETLLTPNSHSFTSRGGDFISREEKMYAWYDKLHIGRINCWIRLVHTP